MPSGFQYWALFALTCVSLATAHAELEWTSKKIVSRADAEADRVSAVFELRNSGQTPVTIISATPNCECARAQVPDKPLEPGSKAQIPVVFEAGQRGGKQKVGILIWTDLPGDKPIELVWKIILPEVLKLEPEVLVWHENSPQTQQLSITFPSDAKTKALTAESDDAAFQASVADNLLRVTRKAEPISDITLLRVKTDSNISRLKEILVPMVFGQPEATSQVSK